MDEIADRKLFILINLEKVKDISNLVFFNEYGQRMERSTVDKQEKAYVLLAMIERNQKLQSSYFTLSNSELSLANKLWVNQIKTDGSFHFDTSGKIFGLGFGPKYLIDEKTNLSIGEFSMKKKSISGEDLSNQILLKKKIFEFSRQSFDNIFSSFNAAQRSFSPNISKLQIHFDLFDSKKMDEKYLQKKGILNAHLCLNAQTRMKHTKCDASYTTISVPPHEKEKTITGMYNKAEFEFNISDCEAIVIPLEIGTTLVYSGFMLTHRQQIRRLNDNVKPFVNIVSYNSQKMFNHLMESFRREIKIDSKRK